MYILGIAGRSHDPSICLLKDGQIRMAVALERFCRLKRGIGPTQVIHRAVVDALSRCFEAERIGWDDIEHVVVVSPDTLSDEDEKWLGPTLLVGADPKRFLPMPHPSHHLAHAYASFYASGFDEAAALIIDGYGTPLDEGRSREAESAFHFKRGAEPQLIFRNKKSARIAGMPDGRGGITVPSAIEGIGEVYRIVTLLLGFLQEGLIYDEPGKTMGLAPYGKPFDEADRMIRLTENNVDYSGAFAYLARKNLIRSHGDRHDLLCRTASTPLAQFHFDLAAQVQFEFEEACVHLARRLRQETGCDKLVLGGGCALNSVANTRIFREAGFSDLFIFPAATDDGTAVGAAYYGWEAACRKTRTVPVAPRMVHAYLGPSYSDEACLQAIRSAGLAYDDLQTPEGAGARAGKLLAEGQIIGWFQGGAEFGPRALGHRSILADPRGDQIKDTLNARVKFREAFRPFAPAVLEEVASKYFDLPCKESPFMLLVCDVREAYRAMLPGITHVDGTARVQTVNREYDPAFAAVIEGFHAATGLPIILNTSFNLKGEPIVETPEDAVRCFVSTEMDSLVLGRYIARAHDIAALIPRRRGLRAVGEGQIAASDATFEPTNVQLFVEGSSTARTCTAASFALLMAMDGHRTVQAIAKQRGSDVSALKPTLLALLRQGLFEWVSSPRNRD